MRKAFGLLGASLFLAGPTLATDLAIKAPLYKAPPMVVPTWAGWYVGGNAGWVGSADNAVTNTGTDTRWRRPRRGSSLASNAIPGSAPLKHSGFLAGGQFGYNWQIRNWVYGLEADLSKSSMKTPVSGVFRS
jgi:outer membrane immunogenic protein